MLEADVGTEGKAQDESRTQAVEGFSLHSLQTDNGKTIRASRIEPSTKPRQRAQGQPYSSCTSCFTEHITKKFVIVLVNLSVVQAGALGGVYKQVEDQPALLHAQCPRYCACLARVLCGIRTPLSLHILPLPFVF